MQEKHQKQKLITRADASSDDDLDSWEEIDDNCLKDEKEHQSKSKPKVCTIEMCVHCKCQLHKPLGI